MSAIDPRADRVGQVEQLTDGGGHTGRIVQRAIGIPVNLFTGVFALARTVGWIAQLNEMIGDPEYKIGRPRQLFTGSPRRNVPGAK